MTDEQIKQNAEAWVKPLICAEDGGYDENSVSISLMKNAFIAGAHSRDEEIGRMNTTIRLYANQIAQLRKEIEQLRNPWISVEDRLPKSNCVVFVSLDGTEYLSAHYRAKSKRFVTVSKDKQTLVEVRKSTATYTVCGDCIKEERLYSEGQREDITSLVTHWMPIPELKKGELK